MHTSRLSDSLAMGTVGHNHLLSAAQKAFGLTERGGPDAAVRIEEGIRLLTMALVEFPLNGPLAAQIMSLSRKSPLIARLLPEAGLRLAGRLTRTTEAGDDALAERLFAEGRFDAFQARLDELVRDPGPLSVARQAVMRQSMLSRWEWLEEFVGGPLDKADPDLAAALLPDILLAGGQYGRAVAACEKLVSLFGVTLAGFRLATAHAGAGNAERAMSLFGRVLRHDPGHVSALLALDRLAFPASHARLPGRCAVSIYSYDKADELRRTLDSVLASDLESAADAVTVRVLINGSRDDSAAMARRRCEGFDGDMEVVFLPVNVGAPAARNWLLDAAAREGADWIAYLDDDVLVEPGWLRGLAAGTVDFPDAGVWGCRVMDAASPNLAQHADGFLLEPGEVVEPGDAPMLQEPGIQSLVPDFLSHRRLCASVTGCCHLFRTRELVRAGGFDLRFSPSQFDDLDLDLRQLLAGKPAAYLGDVAVTHLRPDFNFLRLSESARIQSESHRALLGSVHEPHLTRLYAIQREAVDHDLAARRARLAEAGHIPAP